VIFVLNGFPPAVLFLVFLGVGGWWCRALRPSFPPVLTSLAPCLEDPHSPLEFFT